MSIVRNGLLKTHFVGAVFLALASVVPGPANGSVTFTFIQTGGTVLMTPSGTLDTTKLVSVSRFGSWGNTGTMDNTPGNIDVMGGTNVGGGINIKFGFNSGTDASAITNPGGPFAFTNLSITSISITGSKSFTTYSGYEGTIPQPGMGMFAADIVGGLWTPDQAWIYPAGSTLASRGLNLGTYTVADSVTGESITIQIVPEPASLAVFGMASFAWTLIRRRDNGTQ